MKHCWHCGRTEIEKLIDDICGCHEDCCRTCSYYCRNQDREDEIQEQEQHYEDGTGYCVCGSGSCGPKLAQVADISTGCGCVFCQESKRKKEKQ